MFLVKIVQTMLLRREPFSQNSLYYEQHSASHQVSFYGKDFVDYLPTYDPTFKEYIVLYIFY